MNRHRIDLIALLLLLVLSGCGDFDPGSLIAKTRVLGARVELENEPEIASPAPGERARVTFITASPAADPLLRWAFVACAANGDDGEPCAKPLATFEGKGRVPALTLEVPTAKELGDNDRIELLGVICERGTPVYDTTPTCKGPDALTMAVELVIDIARSAQRNANPDLTDARLALDGGRLAADSGGVAAGACEGDSSLQTVKADGKEHDLALALGAHVRERYRDEDGRSDTLERLQVSQLVTAGELERQHSFVETSDGSESPRVTQSWTAPKRDEVSGQGDVVRFVTVVRDLRGGLSVLERSVCVVR